MFFLKMFFDFLCPNNKNNPPSPYSGEGAVTMEKFSIYGG